MNRFSIVALAEKFINDSPGNYITKEVALHPGCIGMKIYDAPIFAFGSPDDVLYTKYKSPDIIGGHFLSPIEWMPSAKTIISFFLPYADKIKTANSENYLWPADEWLHGRYEGQILLKLLTEHLTESLMGAGFKSLAPSNDPRFKTGNAEQNIKHTSNWSERHVAFACGLGTFGLSKGIITKKGMSGRLGSILTELDLPKDNRSYSNVYEYCNMCGICIDHCPAHAISFEEGKSSALCSDFLDKVRKRHSPRFGCGKCQVNVPCESEIPVTETKMHE